VPGVPLNIAHSTETDRPITKPPMVSKPAYKPATTMISPQSIIIDDAIGQSVRFFGSSLIQYLAHIIHRHVDANSLSGAFALSFSGFFTNNFAATSMKPMKSRLIAYKPAISQWQIVGCRIDYHWPLSRYTKSRIPPRLILVYLVWVFPTWWVFLFRGEDPTPPAENEGKHYL